MWVEWHQVVCVQWCALLLTVHGTARAATDCWRRVTCHALFQQSLLQCCVHAALLLARATQMQSSVCLAFTTNY